MSNRIFYMDQGLVYEEGTPQQIFENPQKERTRAFIHRIRSLQRQIGTPDFDFYALNAEIETFCERQFLPRVARHNLLLLVEELLQLLRPRLALSPIDLAIGYSEKSGSLELVLESEGSAGDPLEVGADGDDLSVSLVRGFTEKLTHTVVNNRSRLEAVVRKA